MRGLSEAYGILEDHLHLAAQRPQRAPREARDVAAVEARSCPESARTGARGSGRASTCRSPTRRRGRASRRPHLERDAVDRTDVATSRRMTPSPMTGKCLTSRPRAVEQHCRRSALTPAPGGSSASRRASLLGDRARIAAVAMAGRGALLERRAARQQAAKACGQRGANAQPAGSASSDGGRPGIVVRRCGSGRSMRGIEPSRPQV